MRGADLVANLKACFVAELNFCAFVFRPFECCGQGFFDEFRDLVRIGFASVTGWLLRRQVPTLEIIPDTLLGKFDAQLHANEFTNRRASPSG